jgi:hypothetical protein
MTAKVQTAIKMVQETGTEVFIVQAGTIHAAQALAGVVAGDSVISKENRKVWVGTRISLLKK